MVLIIIKFEAKLQCDLKWRKAHMSIEMGFIFFKIAGVENILNASGVVIFSNIRCESLVSVENGFLLLKYTSCVANILYTFCFFPGTIASRYLLTWLSPPPSTNVVSPTKSYLSKTFCFLKYDYLLCKIGIFIQF